MEYSPTNYYDEVRMTELNTHQFNMNNYKELNTMLESESAYLQHQAVIKIRKLSEVSVYKNYIAIRIESY